MRQAVRPPEKRQTRTNRLAALTLAVAFVCGLSSCRGGPQEAAGAGPREERDEWAAVLVAANAVDSRSLADLQGAGYDAVVLEIGAADIAEEIRAARAVLDRRLGLYYWIEVGRCPELADAHPEWMASVQGHPEWRRLFPDAPRPGDNEVVKVYPWTPILYREVFDAQLERIGALLEKRPPAGGVFLNDLQGAPSACGCGHPLCRWTTDYGPLRTATRLGPDAAARFVAELRRRHPAVEMVPVWATECEEHDGASDGACAGVGCYRGACWKEYAKQLGPLVRDGGQLGVLATYKELGRDLPIYGKEAAWVSWALESFSRLPPAGTQSLAPTSSLIAVLQGWDVTDEELREQVARAREAGVRRRVVARRRIDASWTPRIHRLK